MYENDDDRKSRLIKFQHCILNRVIELFDH